MEKRVEVSLLLDFYSVLLTEKQRDIMDLYFNKDLSLSEISENNNTSRQAIHDVIKRCHNLLMEYEEKLQLMEKTLTMENSKTKIINKLNEFISSTEDSKHIEFIEGVIEDIRKSM